MNQISVAGVGFVVVWNWEQLYTLSVSEFVSINLSYLELPLSWHYVDPLGESLVLGFLIYCQKICVLSENSYFIPELFPINFIVTSYQRWQKWCDSGTRYFVLSQIKTTSAEWRRQAAAIYNYIDSNVFCGVRGQQIHVYIAGMWLFYRASKYS